MGRGALPALLSLAFGTTAAAIAVAWLAVARQTGVDLPIPEDLADVEGLMAARQLMTAFTFGLPVAAALAVLMGVAGLRELAGKIGLALAVFALAVFAGVMSTLSGG